MAGLLPAATVFCAVGDAAAKGTGQGKKN